MAKQINVGVGGVVKTVKEIPISIGGVVKKAQKGVCGVGGVVKEFFSANNDLILWNGSSLQNGATWSTEGTAFSYSFSAGSLYNKKLVVKVKSAFASSYINLQVSDSSGKQTSYLASNGMAYASTTSARTSWASGTEYLFDLSIVGRMDTATSFTFRFIKTSTVQNLTSAIEYIAIR